MRFTDINVLVYAYREDTPFHEPCRRWLTATIESGEAFGIPEPVQYGFLRVSTHPRIHKPPSPFRDALGFLERVTASPSHHPVVPGPRIWQIFCDLCAAANATGNLITDAYLASLAIEADAELVSCDRDFARFPGLRWFNPVA